MIAGRTLQVRDVLNAAGCPFGHRPPPNSRPATKGQWSTQSLRPSKAVGCNWLHHTPFSCIGPPGAEPATAGRSLGPPVSGSESLGPVAAADAANSGSECGVCAHRTGTETNMSQNSNFPQPAIRASLHPSGFATCEQTRIICHCFFKQNNSRPPGMCTDCRRSLQSRV